MTGVLWIPVSVLAACFQIVRTGLQKSLKAELDDWSVTWVRSGFALPLAALYYLAVEAAGFGVSGVAGMFWVYCALAALAQVMATVMLVALFSHRNFAVSTAFSKTEAPQIALWGFLFFGEGISALGAAGVLSGFFGILMMTGGGGSGWRTLRQADGRRALGLGLGSGLFFALTALFIRRAFGELAGGIWGGSALALLVVIGLQTAGLGLWLLLARPQVFNKMWRLRGKCLLVGLTSVLGSACWFGAFSLANPAYVKTLAQIELPLAWLIGHRAFREKPTGKELVGMALVAAGAAAAAFAGWGG